MSTKPQIPRRADFPVFRGITTRWMDNDVYGHVNNVHYYSYFDTAVNRVDLLGPEDRLELNGVRGGGGTDLGAAFRWAEKSGRSPVVTVVLTDLYGPFDLKVPHAPVIWCVSKGGARGEVPYGSCVRIED